MIPRTADQSRENQTTDHAADMCGRADVRVVPSLVS
jgi:hypothetical protein